MANMGCGSEAHLDFEANIATQLPPVITRIDPSTAAPGDTVTIHGFGFSVVFVDNLILIDDAIVPAESYALNSADPAVAGEIEMLTVTIPSTTAAGTYNIALAVYSNTSNSSVTLTVTP